MTEVPGVGPLTTCPVNYVTPDVAAVLSCWSAFKNGVLPRAGGLLDQAATFVEAINILESELSKLQKEKFEEERAKANAARGRR
jgi:hypothetical protein